MKEYEWKEWQRHKCEKLGHDWAIKDYYTYMSRVCLRCGFEEFFLPVETEQEVDE